jgi:hypothetical protein
MLRSKSLLYTTLPEKLAVPWPIHNKRNKKEAQETKLLSYLIIPPIVVF